MSLTFINIQKYNNQNKALYLDLSPTLNQKILFATLE